MLKSSKTIYALALTSAFIFIMPARAFAMLEISEIMYDPPGSNAGRQWIQIVNTGTAPVDLGGYKLFQNDTNHALVIFSGTTTLSGGAVAIAANDPQQFLTDYPSWSGSLFRSAFSLRSTGDTLTLKDAKLVNLDSASYSSGMGGHSDGNALYRTSSGWASGAPDPSVYHTTPPAAIVAPPPAPSAPKSSPKSGSIKAAAPSNQSPQPIALQTEAAKSDEFAATAPPESSAHSLIEIIAGSAAFGIVVVAGILLTRRLDDAPKPVPQPAPISAKSKEEEDGADAYEILASEEGEL